jgi:outer membrane protein assembly factor BamD (BamD/ComL family)
LPQFLAACCLLLLLSGCVTPWERSALVGKRDTGIDNVQGPTERRLRSLLGKKQEDDSPFDASGALKPIPGTDEYLAAEAIYEQGDYKAAEKAFHKVSRKFKKSDIREDALFMEAESAYQQKHYADANDLYAGLLKDYPSTRHLDDVTKRLFETAKLWLDFPETAGLNEVEQVDFDDFTKRLPPEEPLEKARAPVFFVNFTDETKPTFDTEGNAVSALRLIWLNDPTGPLADDALMMTASHYARRGNYIEADRHYTLLREEYPNSPHVQTAFLMGSHVKLMSYQGPDYEGKTLEDAEQLKESTLRLYPASEDRQRLEAELQRIEEAKAAREWGLVVFYERKRNKRAQAVYCHLLLKDFPDTSYADRARERLKELGPEYANGAKLLQPVHIPEPSIWKEPGSTFQKKAPPPKPPVAETEPATKRRWFGGSEEPEEETTEEAEEPAKPPRRLWFGPSEKDESTEEPESPGEEMEAEPGREVVVGDEAEDAEPGSRWGRLFRFTPPKRLNKDDDAQPNEADVGEETEAGTSKL